MCEQIKNKITFVTGIWDLNRGNSSGQWQRSFDHYKDRFVELLQNLKDHNLIIFIDESLEELVWQYRDPQNTKIYHQPKESFGGSFFPFFNKVQSIRENPSWYNQAAWLKDSTQGSLEYYNPMVMSKMFLLHNAKIFNPFNSDYLYWIDGGLSNTMSLGYFNNDNVINNLIQLSKNFLFIAFPYETTSEIHGFCINGMKKYAKSEVVNRVARGGFFGGHKNCISEANGLYYKLLEDSLNEGYMGTEESIFTIMTYLDPEKYHYEMIEGNGLVYYFFEQLQKVRIKSIKKKNSETNLYIISYNSPEQLKMVLSSFEKYDTNFLSQTNKVLINNSDNGDLFNAYEKVCQQYDFTEIRQGNTGICGGRQIAAEHFDESGSDHMFFFEDDMLLDYEGYCSFGLSKNVKGLYETLVKIMNKEGYDFLKFSFSEFYGHNALQWSWHNVPQHLRDEYFGNLQEKPYTLFRNIKSFEGVPYADGEIYYSNWPHIISKEGNKKCFLDTKWAHPYEQTWMSHIYTLTRQNIVRPAILLASPITHNRVHHYHASQRKEN